MNNPHIDTNTKLNIISYLTSNQRSSQSNYQSETDIQSINPQTANSLVNTPDQYHNVVPTTRSSTYPSSVSQTPSEIETLITKHDKMNQAVEHMSHQLQSLSDHLTQIPSELDESESTQPKRPHGHTYSTIASGPRPQSITKSAHITITSAPHAPVILCVMKNNVSNIDVPSYMGSSTILQALTANDITVLCCSQHADTLRKQFPTSNVTHLTTLHATVNATPSAPPSTASSIEPPSSTSATGMSLTSTLEDHIVRKPKTQKLGKSTLSNENPYGPLQSDVPLNPDLNIRHQLPLPSRTSVTVTTLPHSDSLKTLKATPSAMNLPDSTLHEQITKSAPASWSDEMNELSDHVNEQEIPAHLQHDGSPIPLLIENSLIMTRALGSRTPRRILRGILDSTRSPSTRRGFPLKFGQRTFTLCQIAHHRHAYTHEAHLPNCHPPYLNIDKPACEEPTCPFNLWTFIPEERDDLKCPALLKQTNNEYIKQFDSLPIYHEDMNFASSVVHFLQDNESKGYTQTITLCEKTYIRQRNKGKMSSKT